MSGLIKYGAITLAVLTVTIVGLRMGSSSLKGTYKADQEMVGMFISRKSVPNEVYLDSIPALTGNDPSRSKLENIHDRGYLRIGFLRDHLPYAYINEQGELVGSDIEMAHTLAADLDVAIQFIRVEPENVPGHLARGEIDILMTGTTVTVHKLGQIDYTIPYLEATMAFIVRDHRRSEFTSIHEVRAMDSVRIGIYHDPYYISRLREILPNAEIIPLESPRVFFRGNVEVDALAFTAESGGAWTILYPEYSVAVPRPSTIKVPKAYIIDRNEQEFRNFMNTWISLKQADGSFESAFRYWVMGEGIAEVKAPRWSVIRDVLHWVE